MADIVNRIKNLGLPKGEYVVIGSGLIDALGYRDANDMDVAVSDELFETLRAQDGFVQQERYGSELLLRESDDLEVWNDYMPDMPFSKLIETAVEVNGVDFTNPEIIISRKQIRNTEKDQQDILYLKEYLARG